MTREDFINGYMSWSDIPAKLRTSDGFWYGAHNSHPGYVALPCNCDSSLCKGWAMVKNDAESIAIHNYLYGDKER